MQNDIFYIGIMMLVGYTYNIIRKFGVPYSYSKTYYLTGEKAILSVFLWTVALSIFLTTSSMWFQLAAASVAFVGFAPDYNDDNFETRVHFIFSYLAIILCLIGMIFDYGNIWMAAGFAGLAVSLRLMRIKNSTFWIELVFFVAGFLVVYMYDVRV